MRNKINDYNNQLALGTIAVLGGVVAAAGGSDNVKAIGAFTSLVP